LCHDKFRVVDDGKCPWARCRKISLGDLSGEPWILFPFDTVTGSYLAEAFRADGIALPQACVTTFSLPLRMRLLATGRYLTILQDSVLLFGDKRLCLKALPIALHIQPVPIAIFTLNGRTLSAVVQVFIEKVREVAKSMIKHVALANTPPRSGSRVPR
jgi:DNA-binding transcriptional LysR family regulator